MLRVGSTLTPAVAAVANDVGVVVTALGTATTRRAVVAVGRSGAQYAFLAWNGTLHAQNDRGVVSAGAAGNGLNVGETGTKVGCYGVTPVVQGAVATGDPGAAGAAYDQTYTQALHDRLENLITAVRAFGVIS
jgi:hypothetical protein